MKALKLAVLGVIAAGAAAAGNLVTVPAQTTVIEEPMSHMGGSGAWLIPLVIVAVLALALTSNSDSGTGA